MITIIALLCVMCLPMMLATAVSAVMGDPISQGILVVLGAGWVWARRG